MHTPQVMRLIVTKDPATDEAYALNPDKPDTFAFSGFTHAFLDFLRVTLVKDAPEQRPSAAQLLKHDLIVSARLAPLAALVAESVVLKEQAALTPAGGGGGAAAEPSEDGDTTNNDGNTEPLSQPQAAQTLDSGAGNTEPLPGKGGGGTNRTDGNNGTFIRHGTEPLLGGGDGTNNNGVVNNNGDGTNSVTDGGGTSNNGAVGDTSVPGGGDDQERYIF